MSTEVFGPAYAAVYDALYGDKDYDAECALIQRLFEQYAQGPVATILDLGCGSGNHAVPLLAGGFSVTGVDRSESMLQQARAKSPQALFLNADIRIVDLNRTFDAALMMFAVLGYQTEMADALAALKTARRHLNPGGLFLFDFWYGPAVLAQLPTDRVKMAGEIRRQASSELDIPNRLCRVHFQVSGNQREPFSEMHPVRFFFGDEIESLLGDAGFQLLRLGSFPDIETGPDASTWNVLAVAMAQ
jgi:SAM-dependent methyltransferase